jgi:hypothetical protein
MTANLMGGAPIQNKPEVPNQLPRGGNMRPRSRGCSLMANERAGGSPLRSITRKSREGLGDGLSAMGVEC